MESGISMTGTYHCFAASERGGRDDDVE